MLRRMSSPALPILSARLSSPSALRQASLPVSLARSAVVSRSSPRLPACLLQLVADVADVVGHAHVAVGLAPGFLGLLLAFAIGLLDVVHVCDLLMSVAAWSDCGNTVGPLV